MQNAAIISFASSITIPCFYPYGQIFPGEAASFTSLFVFWNMYLCILAIHLSMYLLAVLSANENTFSTLENMLSLTDKIIACFSVKIFSNAIRCHK